MTKEQAKAEIAFAQCVVELLKMRLIINKPMTFKRATEILKRTVKAQ